MRSSSFFSPSPVLPWEDLEEALRRETAAQWAERFHAASLNQFNQIQIVLNRFATNSEIAQLFELLGASDNHTESLHRWRETLESLSPSFFTEDYRYQRSESFRDDHHFLWYRLGKDGSPCSESTRKTVIGFTGKAGNLMAPISCYMEALSSHGFNILLIRRKFNTSYFQDEGKLISSIHSHLQEILSHSLPYAIPLGSSGGGLAALFCSHALKLSLGLAIAPGISTNQDRNNAVFEQMLRIAGGANQIIYDNKQASKTHFIIASSANNPQDRFHALEIKQQLHSRLSETISTEVLLFDNCTSHNVIKDMADSGIPLKDLISPILSRRTDNLAALTRNSVDDHKSYQEADQPY